MPMATQYSACSNHSVHTLNCLTRHLLQAKRWFHRAFWQDKAYLSLVTTTGWAALESLGQRAHSCDASKTPLQSNSPRFKPYSSFWKDHYDR